MIRYSPHQLAYFAHQLTLRAASDAMDSMAGALLGEMETQLSQQVTVQPLLACEWEGC